MSVDLTFLSDSYTKQILHQLQKTRTQKTDQARRRNDFGSILSAKGGIPKNVSANAKEYAAYLKEKYGAVSVQDVAADQRSMDNLGMGTAGTGNVVIASNILEQMAADPQKAAYYEGKIQEYFDELPKIQAEISAMGHEIHSCGIVIHPDGTAHYYITGDLKPSERAKIEARIKAEDEAKAKRREMYFIQSEDAAARRALEWQDFYKNKMAADQIRLDLTGERGVLTDRGTDWLAAFLNMGGYML